MSYLHAFFTSQTKTGWETYTPSTLRGILLPFYEATKTNNAPLSETKLGRDLSTCPFVVRRRNRNRIVYDVNWDWKP